MGTGPMGSTRVSVVQRNGPGGLVYFLGFLGATIHYIQAASGFGAGVAGVLKAFVWPAFLVYEVLRFVGAS